MTDKEKLKAIRAEIERLYKEHYGTASTVLHTLLNFIDNLSEEPVSEDLEEAADEYAPDFSNSIASKAAVDAVRDAFKAGAQWQKKQIMKNAIEATVKVDAGGYPYIHRTIELYDYDKDEPVAKKGDKVKVIIIKDE